MTYQVLLLLHLVSAFLVFAGAAVAQVTRRRLQRTEETSSIVVLLGVLEAVPRLTLTGALLALVTGTALLWLLGYPATSTWVVLAYLIWGVAWMIRVRVIHPAIENVHVSLEAALAHPQPVHGGLVAALQDPRIAWGSGAIDVCNLLLVVLMVFKPGM